MTAYIAAYVWTTALFSTFILHWYVISAVQSAVRQVPSKTIVLPIAT